MSRRPPLEERPVQSFDVFDTCLVRSYLDPDDLLYDCAARVLLQVQGTSPRPEDVAALVNLRISAHRRLLGTGDRDEVPLDDIYDAMGDLSPWDVTREQVMATELALERACARPVAAMATATAAARAAGRRVVFLSDMWLPEQFVRQLLLDAGVAEAGDLVRVSSRTGRSKWTGRLFREVLEQEGLAPADVHHRGDNPRTDYAVPRSLGIAATLVLPTALTRYEELALAEDGPRHVRSRLAGASRSVRLSYDDPPSSLESAATGVAADVAGPLVTSFVSWVLTKAEEDGVRRLLFVARDGQVMLHAARALVGSDGGPELEYLSVSRRSMLLASLPDTTAASLEQVLPPPDARTPRRALAAVGVQIADVLEQASAYGLPASTWDRPVSGSGVEALEALLGSGSVQQVVARWAAEGRAGVLGYLGQQGLLGQTDWALVDVGWNLRLQRVIRDLSGRTDTRTAGYYLGARPEGVELSQPGPYRAFLLQGYHEASDSSPAAKVFRNHTALEALLTPGDHGSAQSYTHDGSRWKAVEGPGPDEPRRRYVARLHDAVVRYAAECRQDDLLPRHADHARAHSLAATALFLADPSPEDLWGLQPLTHADDVDQVVQRPVVQAISVRVLTAAVLQRLRSGPRTRLVWKAGSAAVSPAVTRRSLAVVTDHVAPRWRAAKLRRELRRRSA